MHTRILSVLLTLLCLTPAARAQTTPAPLPILFVHGNGDDAVRWVPTIWLFESNGYPADRLFALRFTNPAARTDDTRDEPFRSSTTDAAAELAASVTRILLQTHSRQLILVGSSRGGLTIRNYLRNGGGASSVAAAILCGTPNHGVTATDPNPGGEFNGNGAFLRALNAPAPPGPGTAAGSETVAGIRMLTLRSDTFDKFAQPTGITSGHPETTTGISFAGPSLLGATNLVLPGKDHREVAFSREAFAQIFAFITGHPPATLEVTPEAQPFVSGVVTGYEGAVPTNQPLAGIHLRICPVSASVAGSPTPVYETTTHADGHWGPFTPLPQTEYEFDLEGQDHSPSATPRHVRFFVAGLPRSSTLWNLRFLPVPPAAGLPASDLKAPPTNGMVLISRPQGYFSRERDPVLIDGTPSPEEPTGLPIRDSFVVHLPRSGQVIDITLRKETMRIPSSPNLSTDLPVAYLLW